MDDVQYFLTQYFTFPDIQYPEISSYFEETQLAKGAYLTKTDAFSTPLCFLQTGYMRVFEYVDGTLPSG